MTGHEFVRPGQVAPDRPPRDRCVVCGEPEAGHQIPHAVGDFGTEIREPAHGSGTWQVFIHSGDDTTSYVIRADSELAAAAIAGQEHGDDDRIDGVDIEPWAAP